MLEKRTIVLRDTLVDQNHPKRFGQSLHYKKDKVAPTEGVTLPLKRFKP
jgi:hypothetical protein